MNFKEEQKEKVEKIEAILREYLPEANGYQSVKIGRASCRERV